MQMTRFFDRNLWCGLGDYVMLCTRDTLRFTFHNKTETQAKKKVLTAKHLTTIDGGEVFFQLFTYKTDVFAY